jgi:hypothetical protein
MRNPPLEIDGASVLSVASLGDGITQGRTRHIVGGREVERFGGLIIAKYSSDPGFYLFHCDSDWNVITDTYHDSMANAIAQAEFEFGDVIFIEVS